MQLVGEFTQWQQNQINRVLQGEATPPLEHRIRHKDFGGYDEYPAPLVRYFFVGSVGPRSRFVSQFVARKRADQALRESEERFALAAQGANVGTLAAGVAHEQHALSFARKTAISPWAGTHTGRPTVSVFL